LRKLSKRCYETNQDLNENFASVVEVEIKEAVSTLFNSYGHNENDKIAEAQSQINGVQQQMQQNVRDLVHNQDDLENIQSKSDNLKTDAQQFQRKSKQLEQEFISRNRRLNFIIAIVLFCILLYILIPVITIVAKYAK